MKKLLEIFFSYILIKGILAPAVTTLFKRYFMFPLANYFEQHFLKTEREMAIWLHYRNKALNNGHNHQKIENCDDGKCIYI